MIAKAALTLGGVALIALFLIALVVEAVPKAPIHVAVIAEPRADPRALPYVVRLSAVDARAQRSVAPTGRAHLGASAAPFEDGVARLPIDTAARALELELDVEGRRALRITCPVEVRARDLPAALFVAATAERPTVIGARTRAVALSLDDAAAHVDVVVPDRDTLAVELLVDGALRDVRVIDVERRARVSFALPADMRPDAVVVAHAAEPWPLARGAFAAAQRGVGAIALEGRAPAQLRPAPLGCREVPPRFPHLWRGAFELASAVFVIALVASLWWRSRAEPRRGALLAVVSGVAMSACLLGLDLVLRLGAAAGP